MAPKDGDDGNGDSDWEPDNEEGDANLKQAGAIKKSETDDDDSSNSTFSNSEGDDNGDKRPSKRRKYNRNLKDPNEMIWSDPGPIAYDGATVDFQMLSNRTWADESVLNYLPVREVDRLVGWATHVTQEGKSDEVTEVSSTDGPSPPNPLLGIQPDSPLPMSMLHQLIHANARGKFKNEPELTGSFGTSALVALGMVLEEMMTANLLPLAERHVRRCRELEKEEEARGEGKAVDNNMQKEKRSFQEWTLPPEEAIYNLMVHSNPVADSTGQGLLPTALPPTRFSTISNQGNHSTSNDMFLFGQSRDDLQAAHRWCKSQKLKNDYVQKNMNMYRWFLPVAPPDASIMTSGYQKKGPTPKHTPLIQNASAQAIVDEHKLVSNPDVILGRICSHPGCEEWAQMMCDHPSCRAVTATTPSLAYEEATAEDKGLFLCEEHLQIHRRQIMYMEHKLVKNKEREAKGRIRRRKCSYADCKEITNLVCDSPICRTNTYSSKGGIVYGLFLCKRHIHVHHQEILQCLSATSNSRKSYDYSHESSHDPNDDNYFML